MNNDFVKKPSWVGTPKDIDFQSINTPLKEVCAELISKLETEQDTSSNFHFILRSLVILNFQTYKAVCELVKDTNQAKYSLQGHFLARTILDGVFNTYLLVDNPVDNTNWFEAAGYKDYWEKFQLEKQNYKNDPRYTDYLKEHEKLSKHLAQFLKIPAEETKNPTLIKYWPTPPQLLKQKLLSPDRQTFLEEMNKWHYQELSEWSHGQWTSVAMAIFSSMPEHHWNPGKFDSDAAYYAQLFLLIILSEIDRFKKYGFNKKLKETWETLGSAFDEVNDYFELRYKKHLEY